MQHVANTLTDAFGGPAQMHLEHLADIHPRGHAQGIENNIAGRAISHVGHVFNWNDFRHHALVAMPAGHFVAGLQAAFDRQVNLDHFEHTCGQLIALGEFLALFFKRQIKAVAGLLQRVFDALELARHILISRADVKPMEPVDRTEVGLVDLAALGKLLWPAVGSLAKQQLFDTGKSVCFDNTQLVIEVQTVALEFVVNDLLGPAVARNAFAGEHLHVDHRAL